MKVLWISNVLFDDIADIVGVNRSTGGGWMQSLLALVKTQIKIGVVALHSNTFFQEINGVGYYLLSSINKNNWKNVLDDFKPDLIHIHGTEYPHTYKIQQYSGNIPCIVSIQGLVSVCSRYALGGMHSKEILRYTTLKDILLQASPWSIQRSQKKRGMYEKQLIANINYIIGRTKWDYAHALTMNPSIKYYYCSEVIRDTFYQGTWHYQNAVSHTIFCSNSSVPLKGIHQVVKALFIVKRLYPDVKVRIAGKNILGHLSVKDRLRLSGYDNYLRNLIYRLGLEDAITFLGTLSAEEMKTEFLRANVFILPSSIENSPNSLAEAQLLGVPIIASYAGGIPDMMPYPLSDYVYRFEEVEMLAQRIIEIFQQREWDKYTNIVKDMAHKRHNRKIIRNNLISIYVDVLETFNETL